MSHECCRAGEIGPAGGRAGGASATVETLSLSNGARNRLSNVGFLKQTAAVRESWISPHYARGSAKNSEVKQRKYAGMLKQFQS